MRLTSPEAGGKWVLKIHDGSNSRMGLNDASNFEASTICTYGGERIRNNPGHIGAADALEETLVKIQR